MASKSKRRRKVLGASCILAALIIAGSSFAWFTSKDEVTNRLSANADYGVSIVESFAPPANWLPGQEVNKDVYAVNTGNIAAFVNEDVKGVLNYTYEKLETAPNTTKGVVLNKEDVAGIEGATTTEAGSVLAWTNTAEALGNKDVKEDGSGWTPSAPGVYIFRRSIDTTGAFTYSGFYYNSGTYYKIVIGDDVYPNASAGQFDVSSATLGSGVTVDEQGIVTDGTPNVQYVIEEKKENEQVTFLYEPQSASYDAANPYSDTNHPARLVVTSAAAATATDTNGNTYNASANAARTEVDYLNKKYVSDAATDAYNQAKMDYDYALALAKARNKLVEAANATKAVHEAAETAGTGTIAVNDTAAEAVRTAAGAILADSGYKDIIQNGSTNSIAYSDLLASVNATITTYNSNHPGSQVEANYNKLVELYDDVMYQYNETGKDAYKINQLLTSLNTDTLTPAQVASKVQELKQELINLKAHLSNYKDTFANLETAAGQVTGLDVETATDAAKTAVQDVMDKIGTLLTAIDNDSSPMGLTKKSADYTAANAAMAAQNGKVTAADTAWEAAVDEYNAAVGAAKVAYDGLAVSPYSNVADNIVPVYAATGTSINPDPVFDTTSSYPAYASIVTKGSVTEPTEAAYTAPGASDTVANLKTAKDTAVSATNAANKAYEDAKAKLTGSSDIVIYVNLAENYETNWTFDNSTSGTKTASFYLNKVLDAGETSGQLIDSVMLADTVTAGAYKDMTFDLNVGLDSAQITYADDQTTVLPSAVLAPAFDMKATVDANNSTVTWTKS